MKDEYDFSDAVRGNPYAEKINKNGYMIVINCGAAQEKISEPDNDYYSGDLIAECTTKFKKINDDNMNDE